MDTQGRNRNPCNTAQLGTKNGAQRAIEAVLRINVNLAQMPKTFGPYFFESPHGTKKGRYYVDVTLNRIWARACQKAGENINLYSGLKHSSCSQYVNEKGLSLSELQTITDHARIDSVKRYAKVEIETKREIMNRKVVQFRNFGS